MQAFGSLSAHFVVLWSGINLEVSFNDKTSRGIYTERNRHHAEMSVGLQQVFTRGGKKSKM